MEITQITVDAWKVLFQGYGEGIYASNLIYMSHLLSEIVHFMK